MYLFDTNILSELLKKKSNKSLLLRLENTPGTAQFTSCICVMELQYGAQRRPDHDEFWARIQSELLSRVEILPIAEQTAITAGDVAAALSLSGYGISPEDLLIAATALQFDMILVTANTRHFERIPNLKLENWLIGERPPRRA